MKLNAIIRRPDEYQASWTSRLDYDSTQLLDAPGSALGRGNTMAGAISDLKRRLLIDLNGVGRYEDIEIITDYADEESVWDWLEGK